MYSFQYAQELIKKLSIGKNDLTWDKHDQLPNGWTLHKIIDEDIEGKD